MQLFTPILWNVFASVVRREVWGESCLFAPQLPTRCLLPSVFLFVALAESQTMNTWSRKPLDKELGGKLRILIPVPGLLHRWRPMEDEVPFQGMYGLCGEGLFGDARIWEMLSALVSRYRIAHH